MGTPVVRPPAAPLVVECPVCKVPLKSQQALEYHASKKNACVPPGIPKHHCVVCDKSFKVAAGLRQHQQGQRHLKKAAGVEAEERLRKAARENAQEAARLESVLAAGCGVCGIERFSRECIMLVHNQSHKHAAAVEEAALKAVAAAAAAAATAEIDDCPSSSSNDLAGSGDNIMTGEGPEKHQTFEHDLDEIYQDLGYSRKDEIVRSLQSHYTEGVDFIKTEMRARVIDKLRLSYQELKALTNANKHFVVGYVQAVRPALMKADTSVARVPKIRKWPNDLLTLQSDQLEPFVQQTLKIQYQGVALVFKIFDITCDETRRDFMWQTQNHIEMYKRMPSTVPRLMKAYFLKSGTTLRGVQIMERCPGVPLAQILERAKKTPSMMTRLAELLGDKLRLMQRHKTWHGDLHADNIIVELDADDRIVNMFLIDFGHTILDLPIDDHNLYGFLDDYKMHYWIPYLRNTGIHVAKDIDNWDDYDFEARSYVGLHGTLVRNMKKDPLITLATVTE
ncbi:hypothetical protein CVIRNUC_004447 [Coccomyxa viridis]|uniref:C2H2-type domain-containing protein n=1 Tax=Coccomyxa viridis TaxID=1274662 RepID=A0AAV1I4T1_9CHLO|nr:hypothetical protein CVIRNUC_004447 [Coccomyxa viridis]